MASSLEWGTQEELILACAVTRHGTNSWDSIAIELQARTTSLPSVTSQSCIEKFGELNRRFTEDMILMVNELRRIRVEELRREVSSRDASIVSLELKVKRMKEETTETDLIEDETPPPVTVAGDDRDDRSFNESNSTSQQKANKLPDEKFEPKSETETETEPDRIRSPWFDNDNDDLKKESEKKNNNNNNSDVQSSASLSLRKKKTMSSSCDEPDDGARLEPMADLLDIIRRDRLGSMFERRLPCQESERYKRLIKQPIDLETVASRLNKGLYANTMQRFFRDLLLLFNNAIVFHGRNSPEHAAAKELRHVVLREMRARIPKPKPDDHHREPAAATKQDAELAPVPTTSATMVPCGSRGSTKPTSGSTSPRGNQKEEGAGEEAKKVGSFVEVVRKRRRNARTKVEIKHESRCEAETATLTIDRKENSVSKRQGVARFLKRMKQNSPTEIETTELHDRSSMEETAEDKIVPRTKKKSNNKADATKKMSFRARAGAATAVGAGPGPGPGGASTRKETRWGKRIGRPPKIQETNFLDSRAATTKRRRDGGDAPARRQRGNKRSRK